MKINKLLTAVFASALLLTTACRKDDEVLTTPKGAYENGYFIANEGNFGKPNAEVSFASKDLSTIEHKVFGSNNGGAQLGDILQSVGFEGDNAYLVVNNSNKIEIVNRYTFKKVATVTENLVQPRYIAIYGGNKYVTQNDFFSSRKLNIYNNANAFVKTISFDRYSEKVVSAANFIYVQTDGTAYDTTTWLPYATGHTITRVNPANNSVDKTITLSDTGIIQDMTADSKNVYVVSSSSAETNLYTVDAAAGTFTKTVIPGMSASAIALDGNQIYLVAGKKVYTMVAGSSMPPTTAIVTLNFTPYGFSVLDGKIFVSDAKAFTEDSEVSVYNTAGTLLKTFKAGMGANGFYKN